MQCNMNDVLRIFCASLWEMIAVVHHQPLDYKTAYRKSLGKKQHQRQNLWSEPVFAIFSVRAKLLQMSMLCRLAWIMGFLRIICRKAFEQEGRSRRKKTIWQVFGLAQEKSPLIRTPLSLPSFHCSTSLLEFFFIPSGLTTKINLNYQ